MNRILEKAKFKIKKQAFRILKPQLVATGKMLVNDKVVKEFYCESLTFNFLQYWYARLNNDLPQFLVSQGSYLRNKTRQWDDTYYNANNNLYRATALLGEVNAGIVFGTGTTTPAALDYVMESLIGEGAGAGQFNYQVQGSIQGCEVTGLVTDFILQRIAINNSGGTINVTELGFYENYSELEYFLCLHDTFVAVPIADTEILTVQLKFSVTT